MPYNLIIIFFMAHIICDALRDAYSWDMITGDKKVWITSEHLWHPLKTVSRIALLATGYYIGIATGGISRNVVAIVLLCAMIPGSWAVWQMIYTYARFKVFIKDYGLNITKFLPFIKQTPYGMDKVIIIERWGVVLITVLFIIISLTAIILLYRHAL